MKQNKKKLLTVIIYTHFKISVYSEYKHALLGYDKRKNVSDKWTFYLSRIHPCVISTKKKRIFMFKSSND